MQGLDIEEIAIKWFLSCEVGSKVYIQPNDETIKWAACGERREKVGTVENAKKKKKAN